MGRILLIPLGLLALLIAAMMWSGGADEKRADLVYVNRGDVITLDINQMSYMQDFRVTYAIREGLLNYDGETLTPIPGIASHYEVSDDKRIYTFNLRSEARWTNVAP